MSIHISQMRRWKFRVVTCPGSHCWEVAKPWFDLGCWSPMPSLLCVYGGRGQLWVKGWLSRVCLRCLQTPSVPWGLSATVSPTPVSPHYGSYKVAHPIGSFVLPSSWAVLTFSRAHVYMLMVPSLNAIFNPGVGGPCTSCVGAPVLWWRGGAGCLGTSFNRHHGGSSHNPKMLAPPSEGWGHWSQTNKCLNSAPPFQDGLCDLPQII